VVGNADSVSPEQIAATAVKVGVALLFTAIVNVVKAAHCPVVGVNVYVVVAKLLSAGDHVPVIPFVDVVGNAASASPEQIAATAVKVGVALLFTTIVNAVKAAHCPVVGVNV
jgi:hypothetical protein